MDGEIDLELFTMAILRLNTAFQKEDENEKISYFNQCHGDLKELYTDIKADLSEDEINYNEYDMFFENGINTFPVYIKQLEEQISKTDNDSLKEALNSLSDIFVKLTDAGTQYYKTRGFIE